MERKLLLTLCIGFVLSASIFYVLEFEEDKYYFNTEKNSTDDALLKVEQLLHMVNANKDRIDQLLNKITQLSSASNDAVLVDDRMIDDRAMVNRITYHLMSMWHQLLKITRYDTMIS